MSQLERAILNTLTWFDIWHQPLTAFECWYWLWDEDNAVINSTLSDINSVLVSLEKKNLIKFERGFWQLASSSSYAEERLAKARWSINKRQRAARAAKLIGKLPFIRLVALANTLATDSAKRDSDIDLLIIVRSGRIFLSRLLITAFMQIIGWRRHGLKIANRICLSFYLADNQLNLQSLAYQDDPYLVYWLASLYPLVDFATFNRLLVANSWAHKFIPHRYLVSNSTSGSAGGNTRDGWLEQILAGRIGNMLEYWAKHLQLRLISRHKNSRFNDGSSAVVVTDSILKFHESDQRPQLANKFRSKQQQILNQYN